MAPPAFSPLVSRLLSSTIAQVKVPTDPPNQFKPNSKEGAISILNCANSSEDVPLSNLLTFKGDGLYRYLSVPPKGNDPISYMSKDGEWTSSVPSHIKERGQFEDSTGESIDFAGGSGALVQVTLPKGDKGHLVYVN